MQRKRPKKNKEGRTAKKRKETLYKKQEGNTQKRGRKR